MLIPQVHFQMDMLKSWLVFMLSLLFAERSCCLLVSFSPRAGVNETSRSESFYWEEAIHSKLLLNGPSLLTFAFLLKRSGIKRNNPLGAKVCTKNTQLKSSLRLGLKMG